MQLNKMRSDLFQPEYAQIMQKWIIRHIRTGVGLTIAIALIECVFVFIIQMEKFDTPMIEYALSYLILPSGCNFIAAAVSEVVGRSKASPRTRAMVTVLSHVIIAFSTYTAHVRFPAIYLGFAVPVVFSVVYGSILLTATASIGSLVAKTVSDLFFQWDPYVVPKFSTMATGLDYAVSMFALASIDVVCLMVIVTEREKHRIGVNRERERLRLYRESITDPLTGIENRNGLRSAFDGMVEDASNRPYWFVMMDMDRFKSINDTYGHAVGDQYLQQMSAVLKKLSAARPFRFGGDEFCLLICDHTKDEVEQICRTIQAYFLDTEVCKTIQPVTISFGVAAYRGGVPPTDLVRYADSALYQAKQNRGSICFYQYPVAYGA